MVGVEILVIEMKRVLECFPTTALHMAVQAPLRGRIVEARPGAPHNNFVGVFVSHGSIEIVQILLSPIASIRRPALLAWLHPCIQTSEVSGKLRWRFVLVEENWGRFPSATVFDDPVPIRMPMLGKN